MASRSSIPREQGGEQSRSAWHCHDLAWEVTFYFCHKLLALLRFKGREQSFISRQGVTSLTYNMWHLRCQWGNIWKTQSATLIYVKSQPFVHRLPKLFLCVSCVCLKISFLFTTWYVQFYFSYLQACFLVQLCLLDDGRFVAILTALSLLRSPMHVWSCTKEKWQLSISAFSVTPLRNAQVGH